MIVMPANNSKLEVGYLAGKYAGRLGHLYGPGSFLVRFIQASSRWPHQHGEVVVGLP